MEIKKTKNNDPRKFKFFKKNAGFESVYLDKSYGGYRKGYKQAAEVLYKKIFSFQKKGIKEYQSMIFPFLFVYRHYFEITLKDLIRKCYFYNDIVMPERFPDHNLSDLWNKKLKHAIKRIEDSFEEHTETTEITEAFKSFDSIDKKAQEFRYPMNKLGKQSLMGLKSIDIKRFYKTASKVSSFLEILESEIHFYWHAVGETEKPDKKF